MKNPLSSTATQQPQPIIPITNRISCDCSESGSNPTGSGGVDTFLELLDTPNTYLNQAGKVVVVKSDESGLEFIANSSSGWRPTERIARDDTRWIDDHTFVEPGWQGSNFFVYYNGSRILTPEQDGFSILTDGGFTYDPTKFQFYNEEFLYTIF